MLPLTKNSRNTSLCASGIRRYVLPEPLRCPQKDCFSLIRSRSESCFGFLAEENRAPLEPFYLVLRSVFITSSKFTNSLLSPCRYAGNLFSITLASFFEIFSLSSKNSRCMALDRRFTFFSSSLMLVATVRIWCILHLRFVYGAINHVSL